MTKKCFVASFRGIRIWLFRYIVVLIGLSGHKLLLAQEEVKTGLVFATPEQLAGIPLASTPFSGTELPRQVDLSAGFPTPGNQGRQNSCVGWAVAYALKSFQEKLEEGHSITKPDGQIDLDKVYSPSFVYNQINHGRDGGALFVDALNILSAQGVASLNRMPYNENDFLTQPTQNVKDAAKRYRIDTWRQVNIRDPKEVKAQLNAGFPVIIGAIVDEGFTRMTTGQVWRMPIGKQLSGHAMVLVGYDDNKSAFKLINSWGTVWGDAGFGWLDYNYFGSVVREGYVAKDATNGPGPTPPQPQPGPVPQPIIAQQATFSITNVRHNVIMPNLGPGMRFDGTLTTPSGSSGNLQIVIQIFYNMGWGQKGLPVVSLSPQFATVQGFAATGTPQIPIPSQGLSTTWTAFFPYYALNVPKGLVMTAFGWQGFPITTQLIAEPVLYLDNFGLRSGGIIPFYVGL